MIVKIKRKFRVGNMNNRAGVGWHKLDVFEIEGDSIEEIAQKVYDYPLPKGTSEKLEAIIAEGLVYLLHKPYERQQIRLTIFRDFKKEKEAKTHDDSVIST